MRILLIISVFMLLVACNESTHDGFNSLSSQHPSINAHQEKGTVQNQIRTADRFYIKNILAHIFLSPAGNLPSDTIINNLLNNIVIDNGAVFGGACSDYDSPSCRRKATIDYQVVASFTSQSPTKSALLINVCTEISETPGIVSVIENKTNLAGVQNPVANDFLLLYQLFYPTKNSNTSLTSLETLFQKAKATSDRTEALKLILYTLCTSPDWLIL